MVEMFVSLLIIGALCLACAAVVEGWCWLRERHRAQLHADDWAGESNTR